MKLNTIAAVLFCALASIAVGDAESDIKKLTERFYDQYLEVMDAEGSDTEAWIRNSKHVTPEFKEAYAAAMESDDLDADPIISAQDTPGKPYKATAISVTGDTAAATMVTGVTDFDVTPLKLSLVLRNGTWLINGINDLKGK